MGKVLCVHLGHGRDVGRKLGSLHVVVVPVESPNRKRNKCGLVDVGIVIALVVAASIVMCHRYPPFGFDRTSQCQNPVQRQWLSALVVRIALGGGSACKWVRPLGRRTAGERGKRLRTKAQLKVKLPSGTDSPIG